MANTNNIPIIGWFSGHVHRDRIYTKLLTGGNGSNAGTPTSDLDFTQVIITSDHTGIAYDNDDGTTKWESPSGGGGSVDLTGYATEEYVDDKIGDIETALDELHNYAQSLITGGVGE